MEPKAEASSAAADGFAAAAVLPRPVTLLVIGMAGSGKTTLMQVAPEVTWLEYREKS